MLDRDLKVVDGASAGAWIEPRLGGEFGAVTLEVPKGYEAYARILHPASDVEGRPVRWSEVADAMGTTAHREMQWYALVRSPEPCGTHDGSRWPGGEPMTGELDEPQLDALCEILAARTSEPENCFFGLCTIFSWTEQVVPPRDQKQPLLKLPMGRDHVVLQGPLSAVDQIGHGDLPTARSTWSVTLVAPGEEPSEPVEPPEFFWRYPPNLIWPPDRSWLVASEVDFDSTLVGGSADLIQAVLDSPDLEAWRVEPDDSLACDADKINVAAEDRN